ncbi:MAG: MotA/TolQ/ExbB proton channel family protein [Elusimicrobiota bacterium]
MALLSLLGLLLGLSTVAYVLWDGGIIAVFVNVNAIILVFGGTIGATMITYPWKIVKQLPRAWWIVFFPRKSRDPQELIDQLMDIQQVVYTGGIDDVDINTIGDGFLRSGLRMILEEQSEQDLRDELETEVFYERQRKQRVIDVFRAMGDFAPIFGLLGTLIGIVQVLKFLGSPEQMGNYMALAITTTFYGIFGCNFIFLPTAGKLEGYSEDGLLLMDLIIVGVLSIRRRERPTVMRRRLERFLTQRRKAAVK